MSAAGGEGSAAPRGWRVAPGGSVAGTFTVPGDKSISHRALMLGALATGETHISGFLAGEDCLATLRALEALGVRLERPADSEVRVHGAGSAGLRPALAPLDMGNAGTAMRLMMGLLAPQRFSATLIGDASLMRRPMERVAEPLRLMGARIDTLDGHAPVLIHGTPQLRAISYTLPVASAQVKSALLLAGLAASGRMHIVEPAPSRDHTERMLGAFGVEVLRAGAGIAMEGGQPLRGTSVQVPADFSSAAFFLVAGCLAADGPLVLTNVGVNPTRTGLIELLQRMGADIRVRPRAAVAPGGEPVADIEVRRSALHGIAVPESLAPLAIDELPVLFIAAACASGETLVHGAHELRVKESDRLAAMAAGLSALGVEHQLLPDGLWIRGTDGPLRGGTVDSLGDHRIAMSFAVAALRARDAVEITDVTNVATSFPDFVALARNAGLAITPL